MKNGLGWDGGKARMKMEGGRMKIRAEERVGFNRLP
jgi:hypothetical protein